jgi:hypothetical protein
MVRVKMHALKVGGGGGGDGTCNRGEGLHSMAGLVQARP